MRVKIEEVVSGISVKPPSGRGCFGYSSISIVFDEDETILFDTGSFGERKMIYEVLNKYNITKTFISHLHFDHCSNLDMLLGIPIYINQIELDDLFSEQVSIDTFVHLKYFIDKLNIIPFTKELFLSNNSRIKFTYGHTRGHSSLEISSNEKKYLIAGDCIKDLYDYYNLDFFANAIEPLQQIKTKKSIIDRYDLIFPGHSEPIIKNKGTILC